MTIQMADSTETAKEFAKGDYLLYQNDRNQEVVQSILENIRDRK
jgi:hypothetical protein